jgi:hypothetical protein
MLYNPEGIIHKVLTSKYGSPILGSSDLPTIGKNRCSKERVNKTEGPKSVPMKDGRGLRLHQQRNEY